MKTHYAFISPTHKAESIADLLAEQLLENLTCGPWDEIPTPIPYDCTPDVTLRDGMVGNWLLLEGYAGPGGFGEATVFAQINQGEHPYCRITCHATLDTLLELENRGWTVAIRKAGGEL